MRLSVVVFALAFAAAPAAWPPLDIQGHRGARGLLPENSIPGFLRALELGVTTLELDVVIAGDSTVVVSHEPWMSHVICSREDGTPVEAADSLNLHRMTYDEIRRYDCGSRGHPRFPMQERMPVVKPRLSDVVEAAEAHVRALGRKAALYNVETKLDARWDGIFSPDPETFTRLVYRVLLGSGVLERSTLQSFDVRTLQTARRMAPAWRTALLVAGEADIAADLERLGFTPAVYSPAFALVDSALVAEVHALGMLCIPWTVNSPADMQRLVGLGVDGFITDYPDRAVQFVE